MIIMHALNIVQQMTMKVQHTRKVVVVVQCSTIYPIDRQRSHKQRSLESSLSLSNLNKSLFGI